MKKNILKRIGISFLLCISFILLKQCKVDNIIDDQLTGITPNTALIRNYSFLLTLKGKDFTNDSTIYFNEKKITTNFINNTTLTCTLQPDDTILSSTGTDTQTNENGFYVDVYVNNVLDDTYSNTYKFSLKPNPKFKHPIEIISAPKVHHWERPHIKIDKQGTLFLIYTSDVESQSLTYSTSSDRGEHWEEFRKITDLRLTHYQNDGGQPSIVIDSKETVHVVYHNRGAEYYIYKDKNNSEWSSARIIRADDDIPIRYRCKLLIDKNNKMILVFNSSSYLYYTDSIDSGFSWSEAIKICNKSSIDIVDATITSSNKIAVIWNSYDDTINLSSSHDGGKTWEIENSETEDDHKYLYSIAASGDKIAVVYQTSDTYYKNHWAHVVITSNFGKSWSEPVQISGDGNSYILKSDKANNLHVAWTEYGPDSFSNLSYRRSVDGGLTWSTTINVSQNSENYYAGRLNFTFDNNGYPLMVWENIGLSTGKKLNFANCLY